MVWWCLISHSKFHHDNLISNKYQTTKKLGKLYDFERFIHQKCLCFTNWQLWYIHVSTWSVKLYRLAVFKYGTPLTLMIFMVDHHFPDETCTIIWRENPIFRTNIYSMLDYIQHVLTCPHSAPSWCWLNAPRSAFSYRVSYTKRLGLESLPKPRSAELRPVRNSIGLMELDTLW